MLIAVFRSMLVVLFAVSVAAEDRVCRWVLDTDSDRFHRLLLANGYYRMHMYDESFSVLEELMTEDLTLDELADVHWGLGLNHRATANLQEARMHMLQTAASGRVPACQMPYVWQGLAATAFEMGRHAEAAEYAETWHAATEAVHGDFDNVAPLEPRELLLVAQYWSHVDRTRALTYVDLAVADPEHDFDAAARVWMARLREGDAPADIPPPERPWLAEAAPSLSALDVMRKVHLLQERRRRFTRPGKQPGMARVEWATEHRSITLDAVMASRPASARLVDSAPSVPVLPPFVVPEAGESDSRRPPSAQVSGDPQASQAASVR